MILDTLNEHAGAPIAVPVAWRLAGLVRAARPQHWVKNLACFAGLIFSGHLFQPRAELRAILAFVGFCLAASAVYLINDICDRALDRANPSKRGRPVASGLLPPSWALTSSLALAAASLGAGWALSSYCAVLTALYLIANVAYSVRLKHAVLMDVMVIAFGFVLRVLQGVYAVEVRPTAWIVLCMFFLALFLGFSKRRGEMFLMGGEHPIRRPVLAKYRTPYLDILLAMTATMSILCYALFTVTGHQGNATLVLTVPLVTYGVTRYMVLVMIQGEGESPERLLTSDPLLVGTAALWILLCVAIIYSKAHMFAE